LYLASGSWRKPIIKGSFAKAGKIKRGEWPDSVRVHTTKLCQAVYFLAWRDSTLRFLFCFFSSSTAKRKIKLRKTEIRTCDRENGAKLHNRKIVLWAESTTSWRYIFFSKTRRGPTFPLSRLTAYRLAAAFG
jgi:hypothetical protein